MQQFAYTIPVLYVSVVPNTIKNGSSRKNYLYSLFSSNVILPFMKKLFHSLLALLALLPATASAQPEHRSFQGHEAAPQTARHATLSSTEAYRKPSFINAATSYTREARKAPVPMRAGDGTTLYGEVTFSNSMNTPSADAIQWGLYSFPASANTSFTQLTLHNTSAQTAAAPTAKATCTLPATTRI